jgi:hypothetical protein
VTSTQNSSIAPTNLAILPQKELQILSVMVAIPLFIEGNYECAPVPQFLEEPLDLVPKIFKGLTGPSSVLVLLYVKN